MLTVTVSVGSITGGGGGGSVELQELRIKEKRQEMKRIKGKEETVISGEKWFLIKGFILMPIKLCLKFCFNPNLSLEKG